MISKTAVARLPETTWKKTEVTLKETECRERL